MLKVKNLSVDQPELSLKNISFSVERGEVVAIVGQNGAGKSMLLSALAGYLPKAEGKIILNNYDLVKEPHLAKSHLGFLPDPPMLEPYLTGYEQLQAIGSMYQLSPKQREARVLAVGELFKAEPFLYELTSRLSPANQQKIGLMISILHQPSLIIWDEPTANLDYIASRQALILAKQLSKENSMVIVGSNDLPWLESVADKILILDKGKQVAFGSLSEISSQLECKAKTLAEVFDRVFPVS